MSQKCYQPLNDFVNRAMYLLTFCKYDKSVMNGFWNLSRLRLISHLMTDPEIWKPDFNKTYINFHKNTINLITKIIEKFKDKDNVKDTREWLTDWNKSELEIVQNYQNDRDNILNQQLNYQFMNNLLNNEEEWTGHKLALPWDSNKKYVPPPWITKTKVCSELLEKNGICLKK